MGLDTWVAVVLFLVLIAPGLFFDLLAEQRHVRASESTLRETGRIALASLVFSTISAGILLAVGEWKDGWLPVWSDFLDRPHEYFVDHYRQVVWTLIAEVGLALLLVWVTHLGLAKWEGAPLRSNRSLWTETFRGECPTSTPEKKPRKTTTDYSAQVCITLTDGNRVMGTVRHYSADLELADRELVLAWPIWAIPEGAAEWILFEDRWERMIIPGNQIARLTVSYRPAEQVAET